MISCLQSTTTRDLAHKLQGALDGEKNAIIKTGEAADPVMDFARSAARTLGESPRRLESRFLYDSRGSALFEKICDQPEYYPTRTEAGILNEYCDEIRRLTGPVNLVELGSGTSTKTMQILETYYDAHDCVSYVPVDVSEAALEQACVKIADWRPEVSVAAINGAYECAFPMFKQIGPVMVIFLGSSIGNFTDEQDQLFWRQMEQCMAPGDFFLLGVDLVKDPQLLNAAYNDEAGVTERFTNNLFARINRQLGAKLDLSRIKHVAKYSAERSRVEIHARFATDQRLHVRPLDRAFDLGAGEKIHTEISRKFRVDQLSPYLQNFGFNTIRAFTDERDWFALLLLQRSPREDG